MEKRKGTRLIDRPEFTNKPKPVTFLKTDKVSKAVEVMSDKNYGSVVITDSEKKVIGIVTERDIVKKLVQKELSANTTDLEKIMTGNPRVANENDDVIDWLRIMSNDRFRRLPVVDEEGKIKVIFTQGDFVSYTWPDLMYQMKSIATATVSKNWALFLIGGGIALYSIVMFIVFSLIN